MKIQRDQSQRSIRISDLWSNLEKVKKKNKELENLTIEKAFTDYTPIEPNPADQDKSEAEEYQKWIAGFDKDFLLNEAFQVLSEINQTFVKNE